MDARGKRGTSGSRCVARLLILYSSGNGHLVTSITEVEQRWDRILFGRVALTNVPSAACTHPFMPCHYSIY
jgi:hypothetical protein